MLSCCRVVVLWLSRAIHFVLPTTRAADDTPNLTREMFKLLLRQVANVMDCGESYGLDEGQPAAGRANGTAAMFRGQSTSYYLVLRHGAEKKRAKVTDLSDDKAVLKPPKGRGGAFWMNLSPSSILDRRNLYFLYIEKFDEC